MMKGNTHLLLVLLLTASGALAAGMTRPSEADAPLQVRTVIKTHDEGYGAKRAPGPSDLLKTPKADRPDAPYLAPKVTHIPKQEVPDAE
jgi:hypothetical protein